MWEAGFIAASGKINGGARLQLKKHVSRLILLLVCTNSLPTTPFPVNIRISRQFDEYASNTVRQAALKLYAGNVDDDHVVVVVVGLVLSVDVGVAERSVELSCHDDFVC